MGSRFGGGVDLTGVVMCFVAALALSVATMTVRNASSGGNVLMISEAAQRSGVRDLRQSALLKARNGITSLAEINRVTKD